MTKHNWVISIGDYTFQATRPDDHSQWRVKMLRPESRDLLKFGGFSIELVKRDLKRAVELGEI